MKDAWYFILDAQVVVWMVPFDPQMLHMSDSLFIQVPAAVVTLTQTNVVSGRVFVPCFSQHLHGILPGIRPVGVRKVTAATSVVYPLPKPRDAEV